MSRRRLCRSESTLTILPARRGGAGSNCWSGARSAADHRFSFFAKISSSYPYRLGALATKTTIASAVVHDGMTLKCPVSLLSSASAGPFSAREWPRQRRAKTGSGPFHLASFTKQPKLSSFRLLIAQPLAFAMPLLSYEHLDRVPLAEKATHIDRRQRMSPRLGS